MSAKADNTQVSIEDLNKAMDDLKGQVSEMKKGLVDPSTPAPTTPVPTPAPTAAQISQQQGHDLQRSMQGTGQDITPWLMQTTDLIFKSNDILAQTVNANIDQTAGLGEEVNKALVAQSSVHREQFEALANGMGALSKAVEGIAGLVSQMAAQPQGPPQAHVQAPMPQHQQQYQQPPQASYGINGAVQMAPQQQQPQVGAANPQLGGVVTAPETSGGWDPNAYTQDKTEFMDKALSQQNGQGNLTQQQQPMAQGYAPQQQQSAAQHYNAGAPNAGQQPIQNLNPGQISKALEDLLRNPSSGVKIDDVIAFSSDAAAGHPPRMTERVQNAVMRYYN